MYKVLSPLIVLEPQDLNLKSLSPLFFSFFDEKLSHPWIQIHKKQLNFLRLSMGFDRKKIKI